MTTIVSDARLSEMLEKHIERNIDGTPRRGWISSIPCIEAEAILTELQSLRSIRQQGALKDDIVFAGYKGRKPMSDEGLRMIANDEVGIDDPKLCAELATELLFRRALASPAQVIADEGEVAKQAWTAVQSAAEWDDRTSPDGYEDYLFFKPDELHQILVSFFETVTDETAALTPKVSP